MTYHHREADEPDAPPSPPPSPPSPPCLNVSEMGFGLLANLTSKYGADLPIKMYVFGLHEMFDFDEFYRHLCKSYDFATFYNSKEGIFAAMRYHAIPSRDEFVEVEALRESRLFKFPDFSKIPATPPKDYHKAFATLIASVSSSSSGASRNHPIPYYVGPGLTPDFDPLLTAGKLNRLGRLEGVTTPYWHLGEKNSGTHFHFEDAAVRSYNLTIAGYKLWIIIRTQSTNAFEALVAQKFTSQAQVDTPQPPRPRCDQWVRHLQVLILPETLAQHDIKYKLIVAGPGDLVLTAPRQYHAVLNLTACLALSINFALPSEAVIGPTVVCQDCGLYRLKHTAIQKLVKYPPSSGSGKRAADGEDGAGGGHPPSKKRLNKKLVEQSSTGGLRRSQRQNVPSRARILSTELGNDHSSASVRPKRAHRALDEEEENDDEVENGDEEESGDEQENDGASGNTSFSSQDEDDHGDVEPDRVSGEPMNSVEEDSVDGTVGEELNSEDTRVSGSGHVAKEMGNEEDAANNTSVDLDIFLTDQQSRNPCAYEAPENRDMVTGNMIVENLNPMTYDDRDDNTADATDAAPSDMASSSRPDMLASTSMVTLSPSILLTTLAASSNLTAASGPNVLVTCTRPEEPPQDEEPSSPSAEAHLHHPSSLQPIVSATTRLSQVRETITEIEKIDVQCVIPLYNPLEPPNARVLRLAAVVRSRFAIKQFCELVALRRSMDAFDVWATPPSTWEEEDNGQRNQDVIRRAKFLKALDTNKAIKHIIQYFFAINIEDAREGLGKINPALKKKIQDTAGLSKSQYNDYLQKGNKWKTLCGGDADTYGGILCFIPATKANPFKVSPTDYLAMVDRQGEVEEFHSLLGVVAEEDDHNSTSTILRAGKAFRNIYSGTATEDVCFLWEINRTTKANEGVGGNEEAVVPGPWVKSQEDMLTLLQPVSWLKEDIYHEAEFPEGGGDPTTVRRPPNACFCKDNTRAEPAGTNLEPGSCSCYRYPQWKNKNTAAMIRIREYPNNGGRLSLQAASEQAGAVVFQTTSVIGYLTGKLVPSRGEELARMVVKFGDLCQLDCREESNQFRLMGHACYQHANAQINVLSPVWVSGRYRMAVCARKDIVSGQEITATWPSATKEETKQCRLCREEKQQVVVRWNVCRCATVLKELEGGGGSQTMHYVDDVASGVALICKIRHRYEKSKNFKSGR